MSDAENTTYRRRGVFSFPFERSAESDMTQEYDTTTELCSGFRGLGAEPSNKLFANSGRVALLARIYSTG